MTYVIRHMSVVESHSEIIDFPQAFENNIKLNWLRRIYEKRKKDCFGRYPYHISKFTQSSNSCISEVL
jgi:hypothetical protein